MRPHPSTGNNVGVPLSENFAAGTGQEIRENLSMTDGKTMHLKEQANFAHVTTGDSILTLVNHPAFKGFGRHLRFCRITVM